MTEKQSKWSALVEAHVNALVGAPIAIGIHVTLLYLWEPTQAEYLAFSAISWPFFFYSSVARIFLFRRLFERYKWAEPLYIYTWLVKKIKNKKRRSRKK